MKPEILIDEDGCLVQLYENFMPDTSELKPELLSMPFSKKPIAVHGNKCMTPRETCSVFFGEDDGKDKSYPYSGITEVPVKCPEKLTKVKEEIEKLTGDVFNFGLLNYYETGLNYINQHSDREDRIVKGSTIASFSVGETRKCVMKRRSDSKKVEINLKSGSLLLMMGKTQDKWTHGITKTKRLIGSRYNITFRRNKV